MPLSSVFAVVPRTMWRHVVLVTSPLRRSLTNLSPRSLTNLSLRLRTWLRLLREYPKLRRVYAAHRADGFFAYGAPCADFAALGSHPSFVALAHLLRGRRTSGVLQSSSFKGDAFSDASRQGQSSSACGSPPVFGSRVHFVADFPVLPTYLPIEDGAAACLGLLGLACADLHEARGGRPQTVSVRQSDAGLATAGYMFLQVDKGRGYEGCRGFEGTIAQEGTVNPTRKAYQCADGSHVFVHGGFPKLKRGILDFFGVSAKDPTVEALQKAAQQWATGEELEDAMRRRGLAATLCRTPLEWRATEQGKTVQSLPPVCFETIQAPAKGDNNVPRMLKRGVRPLSDVIVVDFSHVIASPMVGRTLAEHGATVFKIFTESRPRRKLFDEETNAGKIPLHLDLEKNDSADRARLWDLLTVADVLVDGYTDGVLRRLLGLKEGGDSEEELHRVCPDLIYLRVSCYGHVGPWYKHKGFQQNANFATGVATVDDEELLCYQLTSQVDYATGFLGAAGVVLALLDRQLEAKQGRRVGIKVHTSLCQAATWMSGFGAALPAFFDFFKRVTRLILFLDCCRPIKDGNITYLPPALDMSLTPPVRSQGFHRWWSSD